MPTLNGSSVPTLNGSMPTVNGASMPGAVNGNLQTWSSHGSSHPGSLQKMHTQITLQSVHPSSGSGGQNSHQLGNSAVVQNFCRGRVTLRAGTTTALNVHKMSVFEFMDVSFTVKVRNGGRCSARKEKTIIDQISGRVESGRMLAILGPSGAGKSTLLNALSLTAYGGKTTGLVTLDSRPVSYEMMRRRAFLVAQQDFHWTFLTCRETLHYAADLYLQEPAEEKEKRVENILQKMGLESCADTRVGNEFVKGLSGGQKHRLSLAVALIKEPDVIFLDEPTSGLDAASAAKIMATLKTLAVRANLIIITTIHQPSTSVFNSFDQVMILSKGREAYVGNATDAAGWFSSQGHPIQPNTNPADHCLDVINADFTSCDEVTALLDAWVRSPRRTQTRGSYVEDITDYRRTYYATSYAKQTRVMLQRQALLAIRDPALFLGRCIVMLFSDTFFALIFINSRERLQSQVANKMFMNICLIGVPCNLAVVAVYAYNTEYKAVRREVKNGMVSPIAYVIANSLLQLPIMFLFGLFALTMPAYGIANFYLGNVAMMFVLYAAALYAWEGFAQLLSVLFENPLIGMMTFMQGWFTAFIFSGWLVPVKDINWPFRLAAYILPLRYSIRGMVYLEFIDTDFEECDPSRRRSAVCYGDREVEGRQQGSDVLDALGDVFGGFTSENMLLEDMLIPLAIAVGFKIAHTILLVVKTNRASTVALKEGMATVAVLPTLQDGDEQQEPVEQVAKEEEPVRRDGKRDAEDVQVVVTKEVEVSFL